MKKVATLVLAIIMCFLMGGCKDNKNKKLVITTTTNIEVVVGTNINWNDFLTIKYGDQNLSIDNADIKLITGNPNVVGECEYTIAYSFDGKTESIDVTVKYVVDNNNKLTISFSPAEVIVGATIVPLNYVTVKYGDVVLDNSKAIVQKISGDSTVEGHVKYDISYSYMGQTVKDILIVNVVDKTDPLLKSLKTALNSDYNNYTFKSLFEIENDNYFVNEVSKIEDVNKYHVEYLDSEGTNLDFFVNITNEFTYIYNLVNGEYKNSPLTNSQWTSRDNEGNYNYQSYYLIATDPTSLNLTIDDFEVVEGKIVCKENRLDLVGDKLFNTGVDDADFTSITLTVENNRIVKIEAYFNAIDDFGPYTVHYTYEYLDFDATIVDLPNVDPEFEEAPEHVNHDLVVELTEDQLNNLSAALQQQYTKYEYTYKYNESNGFHIEKENALVNGLLFKIMYEYSRYDGYFNGKSGYYFYKDDNGDFWVYTADQNKNYIRTQLTTQSEIDDVRPYDIQISDFGFNISDFGYANGKYIAKKESLENVGTKIFNDPELSLVACEMVLDNGHIVDLYIVVKVTSSDAGLYYYTLSYQYSNFENLELSVPVIGESVLVDPLDTQLTTLTNAFNQDYTNMTIYDGIGDSTFYFTENKVRGHIRDSLSGKIVVDNYLIQDGKYYEVVDEGSIEIPYYGSYNEESRTGEGFTYYVPVPDFTKIDLSKVKYDPLAESYNISVQDINLKEFCLYYYDFGINVLSIDFTLYEDGTLSSVLFIFEYDGKYLYAGLEYSDYNTTTIN